MSESSLRIGRRGRNAGKSAESAAEGKRPKSRSPKTKGSGGGRSSRRAGDKRERILSAAVRVFAENGFYDTRVSDVAKAAGVADGTIYLYFRSKDELLISLFEDRLDKLLAFMEKELDSLPDAKAKLRRVIEMQLGLLEGERDLAEVITVILRQSTRLIKEFAAPKFTAYLDAIARVVSEGQAAGTFRRDLSPNVVAVAVFGSLDAVALTWALGRAEAGALVRASKQIAEVFLRGLEPEPGGSR